MKVTPRKGEDKRDKKMKIQAQVHAEAQEPPSASRLPSARGRTAPAQSELERGAEEAEKLGEVGRSPESSSTWQLAQMAEEARPSMSGGEEPAKRKLQLTVGGKAPQKEFLKAGKVKKPQRYQPGIVALHEICQF